MEKLRAAILGATGMVGQRFIEALVDHPLFEIGALAASDSRKGVRYADTKRWKLTSRLPEDVAGMRMIGMNTDEITKAGVRVAFSALPSDVAVELEAELAAAGIAVFSNTSSHRMDPDVPLLIPEVNHETIDMVAGRRGYIVTNANCSTTGIVLPLKVVQPLGIRRVIASTYQAVTGAGYPGIPSLDILGNVIPYIGGEEDKMRREARKILGTWDGRTKAVRDAEFELHASCVRIPAVDGHLENVEVELEKPLSEEEIIAMFEEFESPDVVRGLPTAPEKPLLYRHEPDRPQHRYDVNAGKPARAWGMAVTVGRVRVIDGWARFVIISHNTRRGAAPGSVLNAELAHKRGYLS
jgi:aspartate-semialdehyde dehydrogenase